MHTKVHNPMLYVWAKVPFGYSMATSMIIITLQTSRGGDYGRKARPIRRM